MKKINSLCLFMLFFFTYSYKVFAQDLSLNKSNSVNYNKEYLKKLIGEKRIVLIGENSHGDGGSMKVRTELVKFLHEEMGFNLIVFESGLYQVQKTREQLINSDINEGYESIRKSIYGIWSYSMECRPLFKYIIEGEKSNSLILAGNDCQLNSENAKYYLSDLEAYLNSKEDHWIKTESYKTFASITQKIIDDKGDHSIKITKALEKEFINAIDSLISWINIGEATLESSFWVRTLLNIRSFSPAEFHFNILKVLFNGKFTFGRDSIMANNLVWLANKYKNEKIIVWAHTGHTLKKKSERKRNFKLQGQYIIDLFPEQVFIFHSTSSKGYAAPPFYRPPLKIKEDRKKSYEAVLYENGGTIISADSLFSLSQKKKTNQIRLINYKFKKISHPKNYFDALIYIPEMTPSTMIEGGWDEMRKKIKSKNKL